MHVYFVVLETACIAEDMIHRTLVLHLYLLPLGENTR